MVVAQPAIVCQAPAPAAPSHEDLYARAVKERRAGRLSDAITDLQALLSVEPENVDARLQLGLALRAVGRNAEAEAAFADVLRRTPDYKDARVALAELQWGRGDVASAKATLGPELLAAPGDPDTAAFVGKLTAIDDKAAPLLWRVDETGSYSALSRGLPEWLENDLSISRKIDAQSAVTASVQSIERFKLGETYLEGAFDHGWSGGEWSLGVGGSLDPTFRPEVAVHGDLLLNPWPTTPWRLAGAFSYGHYVVGDVETVSLGADRLFFGDRGKLSARFIDTRDETGAYLAGFSTAAAWRFNAILDAAVSYVDSAENDTGTTVRVRALGFAGNYTLSERAIFHLSVTHESRQNSYGRTEVALGATAKF